MATSSIDYQARAERMIKRWAGVRGKVRTDEERKVNEIFTDRFENGKEPDEYVEGIGPFQTTYNIEMLNTFSRNSEKSAYFGQV